MFIFVYWICMSCKTNQWCDAIWRSGLDDVPEGFLCRRVYGYPEQVIITTRTVRLCDRRLYHKKECLDRPSIALVVTSVHDTDKSLASFTLCYWRHSHIASMVGVDVVVLVALFKVVGLVRCTMKSSNTRCTSKNASTRWTSGRSRNQYTTKSSFSTTRYCKILYSCITAV